MGEPAGELSPLQPATAEPPANPEPVVEPLAEPAAQPAGEPAAPNQVNF